MTQVEIEQLILENGFKLEDKEGHITYEFGTGDIYRISQLLFKKMNYIPCCETLKDKKTITFDLWCKIKNIQHSFDDYYLWDKTLIEKEHVLRMYKSFTEDL